MNKLLIYKSRKMNIDGSVKNKHRLNKLLEQLKKKLKNFVVTDKQGQPIGQVKDLILDGNRQLQIVIFHINTEQKASVFLLSSKLIEKIEPANKSVIVNINKAEVNYTPEYVTTVPDMELPKMQNSSEKPADKAANESVTEDIGDFDDIFGANEPEDLTPITSVPSIDIFAESDDALFGVNDSEEEVAPIVSSPSIDVLTELDDALFGDSEQQMTPTAASLSTDILTQPDNHSLLESSDITDVLEEEIISLLGERLVVDRSKRKIGEVIVRKEIEILMVQVPVKREKLIVEQVSPEHKQLAEINLGQEELAGIDTSETATQQSKSATLDTEPTVRGEFKSPKIASLLLNAIALERRHGCKKVRVEIVVEDAARQKNYQEWFDRSGSE